MKLFFAEASFDHQGFRETALAVPHAYPTLTKERVPRLYSGRLYLPRQKRVIRSVA